MLRFKTMKLHPHRLKPVSQMGTGAISQSILLGRRFLWSPMGLLEPKHISIPISQAGTNSGAMHVTNSLKTWTICGTIRRRIIRKISPLRAEIFNRVHRVTRGSRTRRCTISYVTGTNSSTVAARSSSELSRLLILRNSRRGCKFKVLRRCVAGEGPDEFGFNCIQVFDGSCVEFLSLLMRRNSMRGLNFKSLSCYNGGSWPALKWLRTAACIKTERPLIEKKAKGLLERRPECYDGKTDRVIGKQARKCPDLMIENPACF